MVVPILQILRLSFLTLTFSSSAFAFETPWVAGNAGASQARLIGEFRSIGTLTNEIKFGLEIRMKTGWHTYWKNPGLIGFPPKIMASLPSGWRSELLFPAPFRIAIKDRAGAYAYGYERNVIYPVILQGKPVKEEFKGEIKVDYLVCDIQCVPETATFNLNLLVDKESLSPFFQAINKSVDAIPRRSTAFRATRIDDRQTKIEFTSSENISDLFLYSKSKVEWTKIEPTNSPSTATSVAPATGSTWIIESKGPTPDFEFTAVWNSATARTGIYSEVSPKTLASASIDGASPNRLSFVKFLSEFALALIFAFLGGLILNLMPCVLPVVGLKTIALLKLREQSASYRKPILFTVAGILTSFIALALVTIFIKSLGHQIGWGFQFQSPGFVTFMIILIFLFALNLFGLFEFHIGSKSASAASSVQGSFFEGVFATLLATPCSAPFLGTALTFALAQPAIVLVLMFLMMGVGLSTPYLTLLFFPSLLKLLPRPGHWMNSLRRFLAYSLIFANIFLLYIAHQQTETVFLFAILGILFSIYILLAEFKTSWRWLAIALISVWSFKLAEDWKRGSTRAETTSSTHATAIPFSTDKLNELIASGRTVFVLVTADWCITCKYNEKTVIETDWFQEKLKSKNIDFMVADWTQRDEKIGEFLKSHDRVAIPFSMLIDARHSVVFDVLLTRGNVEASWDKFF